MKNFCIVFEGFMHIRDTMESFRESWSKWTWPFFRERERARNALCSLFLSLSLTLSLSPSVEEYRKRWNPFESGDRDPRRPFLLATKEKKKRSKTARPNRVKVHSSIFPFFHSRIPLFSNDTFNHVVISPPLPPPSSPDVKRWWYSRFDDISIKERREEKR